MAPPTSYKPIQPAPAKRERSGDGSVGTRSVSGSVLSSMASERPTKRLKAVTQACHTCRRFKARVSSSPFLPFFSPLSALVKLTRPVVRRRSPEMWRLCRQGEAVWLRGRGGPITPGRHEVSSRGSGEAYGRPPIQVPGRSRRTVATYPVRR